MKTLFLFIAILITGTVANAQDSASIITRNGNTFEANQDSTGIYFSRDAIGFKSPNAGIGIARINGERFLVFSNTKSEEPKGILMKEDGSGIMITCDTIIILRKTFSSHAEADARLYPNEEYYLTGDRSVYRKP